MALVMALVVYGQPHSLEDHLLQRKTGLSPLPLRIYRIKLFWPVLFLGEHKIVCKQQRASCYATRQSSSTGMG